MIASDLNRSMEVCIATLHAAGTFLFGDPLCHSPLPPLLESSSSAPQAALSPASHMLPHIERQALKRKHKQTKNNPHIIFTQ